MLQKIRAQKSTLEDPDEARQIKLERSFQLIMSRRDSDSTRGRLYQSLRSDMADSEVEVASSIVSEAIDGVKDTTLSIDQRVTYYIILSNVLVELRAEVDTYVAQFEQIRDAKIETTADLGRSLALNGEKIISLTDLAKLALRSATPVKKDASDILKD